MSGEEAERWEPAEVAEQAEPVGEGQCASFAAGPVAGKPEGKDDLPRCLSYNVAKEGKAPLAGGTKTKAAQPHRYVCCV